MIGAMEYCLHLAALAVRPRTRCTLLPRAFALAILTSSTFAAAVTVLAAGVPNAKALAAATSNAADLMGSSSASS